ncbi:hypothetical protein C8A03DRAFT_14033 [Achaetomium macrosporum]|uniref:Uncharacterized protein n=1 Tax=Achaetomium macrosporum TaxID=79813 RepID=A0AAN7H848_9PEZI|nr:hypothetical protein C8A03DRAFT_14033 [Achaetomium macrosporum]
MAVPTPGPSLPTTCLVVSEPASTWSVEYSSGDTAFLGTTTYTAPTTIFHTRSATIGARCFTLSPGQTIATSVPFVGVTCSTTYYPAITETVVYTSGQPFAFLGGTRTADETVTYTLEAGSSVFCSPLPDYQNPATCDTVTPLTWASLVVTFIVVQLSWWVFELPLLFKRDGGFKAFLSAITWACIRSNTPGCAAALSLVKGSGTAEYARVYYLGKRGGGGGGRDSAPPPEFTAWKLATCIGADLLSLVATGITVYQACSLPEFDARRFGLSLWAYPSLPTALIGLCFLAGQRFFPRTVRAAVWLVLMGIFVLVLVGVALALVLWRFNTTDEIWFVSVIFYGLMAFPTVVLGGPLLLLAIGYGFFARVSGVSIAALKHHAGGQPYCKMQGVGFAAVYLALGGISALLALVGILYHNAAARGQSYKFRGRSHSQTVGEDGTLGGIAQKGSPGLEDKKG